MHNMGITRQSILESLFVAGVFIGILFPLRFVFYHYLSHYWIGAFGITSVVMFLILYLSSKGKLGKAGTIIIKRLEKRAKGKTVKGLIIFNCFILYFWSLVVIGATYADPIVVTHITTENNKLGIKNTQQIFQYAQTHTITIQEYIISLMLTFTPNPISFGMFKVLNTMLGGWLVPLLTILIVEQSETLGILLYLRYRFQHHLPKE